MEEPYFKKIMTTLILVAIVVLSFFLLKPILLSIIFGLILAFIFTPLYDGINKIIKSKNISSALICLFLIILIVLPIWFLTPILIDQSFKIYLASQQMDFVTPLKTFFPSFFASQEFSAEVGSIIHSFVTRVANSLVNSLSQLILNFPTLSLHFLVVFFTLFYTLRDKEQFVSYIQSLLPFSKDVEKKLFESSKGITSSVLYGQVIVGILQGLIAGIGLFASNVPNALFLTLLACLAGIFPIIGPYIVWLPVSIYLIIGGNNISALILIIFGLISSTIDNFLRPIIISKRTKMNPSLILIGMIGGVFFFGILGIILGPLIIAYLLIVLEIYRDKKIPEFFLQNPPKN